MTGKEKEPLSQRDIITVATSEYIGIQVLTKGRILEPFELRERAKAIIEDAPDKIKLNDDKGVNKPKRNTPWHNTNSLLFTR